MKKMPKQLYPEILVCGYPRSGTSVVTELVYGLTGYPKPPGFLYPDGKGSGYNEFVETYTIFHYLGHGVYDKQFFIERKFNNDIMWQEISTAIVRFLHRKKCFIFKENHLLTTISGFKDQFEGRKVVYVERDIKDVYRSILKRTEKDSSMFPFAEFMKDYALSTNAFTGS